MSGKKPSALKHASPEYKKHQSDGDVFPILHAQKNARKIDLKAYDSVCLLGLKVARAFEIPSPSLFKILHIHDNDEKKNDRTFFLGKTCLVCRSSSSKPNNNNNNNNTIMMIFPHPSGVSHFWNKEENRIKASKALKEFIALTLEKRKIRRKR